MPAGLQRSDIHQHSARVIQGGKVADFSGLNRSADLYYGLLCASGYDEIVGPRVGSNPQLPLEKDEDQNAGLES